jgi:hypothetical protein
MITENIRDFLLMSLTSNNMPLPGLDMCELGNQIWFDGESAKKIFITLGVNHVSLDWNGLDGAVPVDLRVPADRSLWGKFDVVTDFGCSEHVENPYEVNRNIHRFARVGGLIIRTVPFTGTWPGHCPFRYKIHSFEKLSKACSYELQINEKRPCGGGWPDSLLYCAMIKKLDHDFIGIEEFNALDIIDSEPLTLASGRIPITPCVPSSGSVAQPSNTPFILMIKNNNRGVSYKYGDVPFEIEGASMIVNENQPKNVLDLAGFSASAIHLLEFAGNSLSVPNDIRVGLINVYYKDGTYESLDLKIGVNIAEWAYDRPEVQNDLRHSKVKPAYSWSTTLDSTSQYSGHEFYVKVDTDRNKPLDYLELIIDPNGQSYNPRLDVIIKAIALET